MGEFSFYCEKHKIEWRQSQMMCPECNQDKLKEIFDDFGERAQQRAFLIGRLPNNKGKLVKGKIPVSERWNIVDRVEAGEKPRDIAKEFSVTREAIYILVRRHKNYVRPEAKVKEQA